MSYASVRVVLNGMSMVGGVSTSPDTTDTILPDTHVANPSDLKVTVGRHTCHPSQGVEALK